MGLEEEKGKSRPYRLARQNTKDGPAWVKAERSYGTIRVSHKGTETKYGGLKSYEAYTIVLGDGLQVGRGIQGQLS